MIKKYSVDQVFADISEKLSVVQNEYLCFDKSYYDYIKRVLSLSEKLIRNVEEASKLRSLNNEQI